MKFRIAFFSLMTLTGCASVDGYVQESRKSKASNARAEASRLAGSISPKGYGNSVTDVIQSRLNHEYEMEQIVAGVKSGAVAPVRFSGQPHPDFSPLNIRDKLSRDFQKKYSANGWSVWISSGVTEGTYNSYGSCPNPPRNGMGLGDYVKVLNKWRDKVDREKITCIEEVKPMYQCKASIGVVPPSSDAMPDKLYEVTFEEKNKMKMEWIRDLPTARARFESSCIEGALAKMMNDIGGGITGGYSDLARPAR